MSLKLSALLFLFLLNSCKQATAVKCFECEDIVHEQYEMSNCYSPNNDTTHIVTCETKCYLFQYGVAERQGTGMIEFIHTTRSCAPEMVWDECQPLGDVTIRKHHCITCETDLCNTASRRDTVVVGAILMPIVALLFC